MHLYEILTRYAQLGLYLLLSSWSFINTIVGSNDNHYRKLLYTAVGIAASKERNK